MERIQELMRQAGLQPYYDAQEVAIAQFAELVIKECIEISQVGSITETKLKKHFGVE